MKILTFLLAFLMLTVYADAKIIRYDGKDIEMNDKYSGKGYPYHDVSFKHETDMKNINIYGSCFYQECRENESDVLKDIFPDDATITFYNCNLDNVLIPSGCKVIGGSRRKIKVQNDWADWILDNQLKPVEPVNKNRRLEKNISINPKDIPKKKFTKEEQEQFDKELFREEIIEIIATP